MAEISRWMIALGAVAAWAGFTVLGMGMSTLVPNTIYHGGLSFLFPMTLAQQGGYVTIAGVIVFILGILLYRGSVGQEDSNH